ncbi:hypothetical protein BC828DRAFT_387525 [Blastocladiella britannica]|nr:hypothetical protein BC828DRAFT_387525 [Blastocladiella britannica]
MTATVPTMTQAPPPGDLPPVLMFVQAQFDYTPSETNCIPLRKFDTLFVLEMHESGWWEGINPKAANPDDMRGWFPSNFVKPIPMPAAGLSAVTAVSGPAVAASSTAVTEPVVVVVDPVVATAPTASATTAATTIPLAINTGSPYPAIPGIKSPLSATVPAMSPLEEYLPPLHRASIAAGRKRARPMSIAPRSATSSPEDGAAFGGVPQNLDDAFSNATMLIAQSVASLSSDTAAALAPDCGSSGGRQYVSGSVLADRGSTSSLNRTAPGFATPVGLPDPSSLPVNWRARGTQDGKIYYYNILTNETRWTLPGTPASATTQDDDSFRSRKDSNVMASMTILTPSGSNHGFGSTSSLSTTGLASPQLPNPAPLVPGALPTWDGLIAIILAAISTLNAAAKNTDKPSYVPATQSVVEAVHALLACSGTTSKSSRVLIGNATLKAHHHTLLSSVAKLMLAARVASGVWPPPDAAPRMRHQAGQVLLAIRHFVSVAQADSSIKLVVPPVERVPSASTSRRTSVVQLDAAAAAASAAAASAASHNNGSTSLPSPQEDEFDARSAQLTDAALVARLDREAATISAHLYALTVRLKPEGQTMAPDSVASALVPGDLIKAARDAVGIVGQLLSLFEDVVLPPGLAEIVAAGGQSGASPAMVELARSAADFKLRRDAVYAAVNDLVTAIRTAMDEFAPPNARAFLHAAASSVAAGVSDVIMSAKLMVEEKANLETSLLVKTVRAIEDTKRDSDLSVLQRRAMSLNFLPHANESALHGLTMGSGGGAGGPTTPTSGVPPPLGPLGGGGFGDNYGAPPTPTSPSAGQFGFYHAASALLGSTMSASSSVSASGTHSPLTPASATTGIRPSGSQGTLPAHPASTLAAPTGTLPPRGISNHSTRTAMLAAEESTRTRRATTDARPRPHSSLPFSSSGGTGGGGGAVGSEENKSATSSQTSLDSGKLAKFFGESHVPQKQKKWFLDYDTPREDIVIDMDGNIAAGTLSALVERLTVHDAPVETSYTQAFLLTFRCFTTPAKFLAQLTDRFAMVPPDDLIEQEDEDEWTRKKQSPVRLRVINTLKTWLDAYYEEGIDDEVLPAMLTLITEKIEPAMAGPAKRLRESVNKRVAAAAAANAGGSSSLTPATPPNSGRHSGGFGDPRSSSASQMSVSSVMSASSGTGASASSSTLTMGSTAAGPCPTPIVPRSWPVKNLIDLEPLELARQLTIRANRLLLAVQPWEFLNQDWTRKDKPHLAPNVKAMIAYSNHVSYWVMESVLAESEPKKRYAVMKFWIKVATKTLELKNYDTVRAIHASFEHSAIKRLKKTWEIMSDKYRDLLEPIRLLAEDGGRNTLRVLLKNAVPPAIPFLGIYLTALIAQEEGTPSMRANKRHINFFKYASIAKHIHELLRFQAPYALAEVPEMQAMIRDAVKNSQHKGNQDALYDASLRLEPREKSTAGPPPPDP